MLLPLAYYGNPILRKKVKLIENVDDSIRQLAADMIETMHQLDGAGLAGPQVHQSLSIFITYIPNKNEEGEWVYSKEKVYINPKIIQYSDQLWTAQEGCLSIPELYVEVVRPAQIIVEATNLEGERFSEELHGWHARAFLHENDHLNGVLHVDRLQGKKRNEIEQQLKAIKKKYASFVK